MKFIRNSSTDEMENGGWGEGSGSWVTWVVLGGIMIGGGSGDQGAVMVHGEWWRGLSGSCWTLHVYASPLTHSTIVYFPHHSLLMLT